MRICAFLVLSLASSLYATVGLAIYLDEAYQNDFHHALLGAPQAANTFFHRPSAASRASLLYTISERLVLGAINPRDGSVIWRQRLTNQKQHNTHPNFLRAVESKDTLITAVGNEVDCWDATDGRLVWQWIEKGTVKSLEVDAGNADAIILSEKDESIACIKRLAADTGKVVWEHHDARSGLHIVSNLTGRNVLTSDSGDRPFAALSSGNSIFYISLHSVLLNGFRIKVTEISVDDGRLISQPILLSTDSEVNSQSSILHVGVNLGTPFLVWRNKAYKKIKVNILGTKEITNIDVPASNGDLPVHIKVHAPSSRYAKAHFLVHYQGVESHWAQVYHIDFDRLMKAYDLPHLPRKGAFAAASQGSSVFFTRHSASGSMLFSSEESIQISEWNDKPRGDSEARDIAHSFSEVMSRSGSTYAVRSAILMHSGNWKLDRNGDTLWTRHEGLAGSVAAAFVELAKEEDLAEELAAEGQSDLIAAYVHRVKRHVRDLRYFPAWIGTFPKRILPGLTGDDVHSHKTSLNVDTFGFHKLVIVATQRGRLAALDTSNQGRVIWDIQAVTLKPDQIWEVLSIESEGNTALVRGEGGEFLRVVSNTGIILQYQPGEIMPLLKTSISVVDASGVKILLPVRNDSALGDISSIDLGEGTIVVTKGTGNTVQGWTLIRNSAPALAWRFMPLAGQNVVGVSARLPHDPIASIGKALGDRNVLYKYLNPNMILVTTVEPGAATANFYLLDSVSGAVVHSASHTGVDTSRPIVSVVSENWLAYSLSSEANATTQGSTQIDREKLRGCQLIVSELYESPYPNDRGSLRSSSNSSAVRPYADDPADNIDTPHVISQTFLLPSPISSMSVTSTLQGITTRSLLCAVPDLHAIISISRAYIDPRRPVARDPTSADMEEGLFRYSPVLDFEPKWMLNHKREILSVSKIITSPSLLESTSMVFAYGDIDLFGTRTAPIGAYDILGKGFSKLQLVLTVAALAVSTNFVAPLVSPPCPSYRKAY